MTRDEAIVLNVIERLQTAGAFHEARIVAGLRGEERALLVQRESGWGMDLLTVHRSVPMVSTELAVAA